MKIGLRVTAIEIEMNLGWAVVRFNCQMLYKSNLSRVGCDEINVTWHKSIPSRSNSDKDPWYTGEFCRKGHNAVRDD